MFKITSSIDIPSMSLRRGVSEFRSRADVPPEHRSRLERFKASGIVAFDGDLGADSVAKEKPAKLEELSEADLFQLDKVKLGDLAKRSGIKVSEGASKKTILDAIAVTRAPADVASPTAQAFDVATAAAKHLTHPVSTSTSVKG